MDGIEEIYYTSDMGNSTIIPIDKNWKILGIQCSGGLDSTLLLYLTAKTIKKLNYDIRILPINFVIPSKVLNPKIINTAVHRIETMLDVSFILPAMEIYIPFDQCSKDAIDNFDGKNNFIKTQISKLHNENKMDFHFNGNTKNPPEHIRKNFVKDQFRVKSRDLISSIYNGKTSASPHAFMDKADIVNLYIKEKILDQLAGITLSCDAFIDKIIEKKLSIPCANCWWCDERSYGFSANGVVDPGCKLS